MRILLLLSGSLISLIAITSCSGNNEKNTDSSQMAIDSIQNSTAEMTESNPSRSFKTKTGKTINISEAHPMGMSISDISISGEGFSDSIVLKDQDPVSDVMEADLDQDGFSEYYIITTAAGSGSYGNIIAVASVQDNTLKRITVTELADPKDYMGHDVFRIEGNKLIRSYPAGGNKEKNEATSSTDIQVAYELKKGNDGNYSLNIIN